jgi:hypothetical protein
MHDTVFYEEHSRQPYAVSGCPEGQQERRTICLFE